MKALLPMALYLGLTGVSFAESEILLECTGDFEHSDTVRVLVTGTDGQEEISEEFRSGDITSREATEEEYDACSYRISPIFGVERTIRKDGDRWVIDYDCGESREISCVASENFCRRDS